MRRPFRFTRPASHLTCLALVLWGSHGAAQNVSPEDMAAARALGTEGVRLAESGDCAGAIPKLAAAEKLFHAPTTLTYLGQCEIKVGKLVAGTEHLQRVVREPLPPNAPPAFLTARQKAQDALGPALPRIARLKIHVDGVPADRVTATVDGVPVSSALFDASRPTDPGTHEVKAAAAGFKTAAAMVMLVDGGESSVSLRLDPDPNAAPPAPAPVPVAPAPAAVPAPPEAAPAAAAPPPAPLATPGAPPPVAPPPQAPASSTPVGAITLLVVGGVGVAVGSIFGVVAMGAKSTLDGECGPTKKACPKQSDIDALNTDALVSDIGFGVGAVGLVIGAVLLATHHGSETTASAPHAPFTVRPILGLGSAGVGGTFE